MAKTKSKKYIGVYTSTLKNGDISYYINFKDNQNKLIWIKIGQKSQGITEVYSYNKRKEAINNLLLGEDPTSITNKRKATNKDNTITLQMLANSFFNYIQFKNKDYKNTLALYNNHLKEPFSEMDIKEITSQKIEQLRQEKLKGNEKLNKKPLAPKTINHIVTLLGTIFNHSINYDELNITNPVRKIKELKTDNKRERFLNSDEIKALYEAIKEDEQITLFVKLALATGGRLDTIANIKKKDIDLINKTITLKDFKNNTTYNGFFDDEIKSLLIGKCKSLRLDDNLILYATTTIYNKLQPVLNILFNNGLDTKDSKNRVVIHTLRHTFASHLAISGLSIFILQRLLNHKDIKMTMRYAKLSPNSGGDEVVKMLESFKR